MSLCTSDELQLSFQRTNQSAHSRPLCVERCDGCTSDCRTVRAFSLSYIILRFIGFQYIPISTMVCVCVLDRVATMVN